MFNRKTMANQPLLGTRAPLGEVLRPGPFSGGIRSVGATARAAVEFW